MRYMDDIIAIAESRAELEEILAVVKEKLKEIGFELHQGKTGIVTLKHGFDFLGYRFRLTNTGKVVMSVDPDRLKAARRKYTRLAAKCRRGEISREKVDESFRCFRNHVSKGDGYRMLKNLDAWYQGLWR